MWFRQAQSVDHFRRRHPAVGLHGFLRHVGEQRIGAAKTHHRKFREKNANADEDMP